LLFPRIQAAAFEPRIASEPVQPIMSMAWLRNQPITEYDAKG